MRKASVVSPVMSTKTLIRIAISIAVVIVLAGLLYWQEQRYRMVGECHAAGGEWDGGTDRCRPVPRIYIERGLKRTEAEPKAGPR